MALQTGEYGTQRQIQHVIKNQEEFEGSQWHERQESKLKNGKKIISKTTILMEQV